MRTVPLPHHRKDTTIPTPRREAGEIANPAVLREASRRGWPMTSEALADAAKLLGVPLYIRGTAADFEAGMGEMVGADRDRRLAEQHARDLAVLEAQYGKKQP